MSHITFRKLMIMIQHIEMMKTSYLGIWSMIPSGQLPHTSNSSQWLWNLNDLVLVQTLSGGKQITSHCILTFLIN